MKLKLRPGTYHCGTPDGTYLLTHRGPISLPGSQLHRWIDRLARYLDGAHTLADLTAALPADRRAAVEKVVATLMDLGVVMEVTGEPAWNTRAAVILGSGPLAEAVARAATTSGLRPARTSPAPGDLVFDLTTDPDPNRALRVERTCAGAVLYPALSTPDAVYLGPTGGMSTALHRFSHPSTSDTRASEAAWRVVANQLVHRAFTELAGGEPPSTVVTRVDLRTLRTTTHRFQPDERARTFSELANSVSDDLFGVFGRINEGDLAQFPLHIAMTTVRSVRVYGVGADLATARHRTALRALATAATGGVVEPGVAAGLTRAEAVIEGLLEHCRALLIGIPGVGPAVELDRVELDAAGSRYRCLAAALPEPVSCHDLTCRLGVPAVAVNLGARTIAYTCGRTLADAVRDGLEQVLLDVQARVNGQPEYAPPPVPDLQSGPAVHVGAVDLTEALARRGKTVAVRTLDSPVAEVVQVMVRDG